LMASRKKRRIRHYPNQHQAPKKSTQHPQGQRRPRFPFFLPNNVKEQKTTKPERARNHRKPKKRKQSNPGKTNRDNPAKHSRGSEAAENAQKRRRRCPAFYARDPPASIEKTRNFPTILHRSMKF